MLARHPRGGAAIERVGGGACGDSNGNEGVNGARKQTFVLIQRHRGERHEIDKNGIGIQVDIGASIGQQDLRRKDAGRRTNRIARAIDCVVKRLAQAVVIEPAAKAQSNAHDEWRDERTASRRRVTRRGGRPTPCQPVRLLVREQRQVLLEVLDMLRPD